MADQGLVNAFNDCIDRLANGETIAECLRHYPQYALDLRPLLEAGLLVRRAQSDFAEIGAAEARVRSRVIDAMALSTVPNRRTSTPITRLLPMVAALILVFAAVIGGSALLSRLDQAQVTPTTEMLNTDTATPTASATATATLTATPTNTDQPTQTQTPTETARPINTHHPEHEATQAFSPTPAACVITAPQGWSIYRIQSGDTLSSLAGRGGITVDEIMRVNCLTDARLIIVGAPLYLPPLSPVAQPTRVVAPTQNAGNPPPTDNNSNDNDDDGNGNGNGNDNGNDNDDDNSGSGSNNNDNDDHGGNDNDDH